jgi:hypothetical protein
MAMCDYFSVDFDSPLPRPPFATDGVKGPAGQAASTCPAIRACKEAQEKAQSHQSEQSKTAEIRASQCRRFDPVPGHHFIPKSGKLANKLPLELPRNPNFPPLCVIHQTVLPFGRPTCRVDDPAFKLSNLRYRESLCFGVASLGQLRSRRLRKAIAK